MHLWLKDQNGSLALSVLKSIDFSAVSETNHCWCESRIKKISFFTTAAETAIIIDAMYMVEIASCIRFVAHDPSHGPNYVLIMKVDAKRYFLD